MPEQLVQILPLLAIALLFYLLILRPGQKRQRAQREMQASVEIGSEVMLTSGVFGTVRSLDEEHVRLEIAPGVVIKVARPAVGAVVQPESVVADSDAGDTRQAEDD